MQKFISLLLSIVILVLFESSSLGYELNGKEATDEGRSSYNDLVNPIFFYISFNPKYNQNSEADKNHNGTFWYGSE